MVASTVASSAAAAASESGGAILPFKVSVAGGDGSTACCSSAGDASPLSGTVVGIKSILAVSGCYRKRGNSTHQERLHAAIDDTLPCA